jgi:hypothetical protein
MLLYKGQLSSVDEVLSSNDMLLHGNVWGHARLQPAKGPRKITANKVEFQPHAVPSLIDLSIENVGQFCKQLTPDFALVYEMVLKNGCLEPVNGHNIGCIVTRRKVTVQCLRALRVGHVSK